MEQLLVSTLIPDYVQQGIVPALQQTIVIDRFDSDTCQWDDTCTDEAIGSTEASTDTTAEGDQAAADAAVAEESTGSLPGIVVFLVNLVAALEQIFILTLVGWPI